MLSRSLLLILHDNDLHFLGNNRQNIAFNPLRSEKPSTTVGESSALMTKTKEK